MKRGRFRMARSIVIDRDECTSCRLCNDVAPETFGIDDEDLAYLIDAKGNSEEEVQEAIDSCPVACITWQD